MTQEQIGRFLLEQGAISEDELAEALRFQTVYGGRLGTCMIDLGYLVVEELAAYLSDYYQTPLPPPEWLDSPDPRAIQLIPLPLIRRIQVLPLQLERRGLHIAMIDPSDTEQLEFLQMASQREIIPYVLPEKRMVSLLETHLGIDRSPRFVGMLSRPRQLGMSAEEAASATPLLRARERRRSEDDAPSVVAGSLRSEAGEQAASLALPEPETIERPNAPAEEILLLEELVAESERAPDRALTRESAPESATSPSARAASLEAQLHGCSDREEIIRLALELSTNHARVAGLFVVRSQNVSGFRASHRAMAEAISLIDLPIGTPSLLTYPALSRMPYRGAAAPDGIDGRLLAALGRKDAQEVFVHPIIVRNRTVNLLYADNGPDPFGETSIAALTALCDCLARAYERLLSAHKQE